MRVIKDSFLCIVILTSFQTQDRAASLPQDLPSGHSKRHLVFPSQGKLPSILQTFLL